MANNWVTANTHIGSSETGATSAFWVAESQDNWLEADRSRRKNHPTRHETTVFGYMICLEVITEASDEKTVTEVATQRGAGGRIPETKKT